LIGLLRSSAANIISLLLVSHRGFVHIFNQSCLVQTAPLYTLREMMQCGIASS